MRFVKFTSLNDTVHIKDAKCAMCCIHFSKQNQKMNHIRNGIHDTDELLLFCDPCYLVLLDDIYDALGKYKKLQLKLHPVG